MSEYLGRAVLQVEADISDVTTKMAQAVSVTDAASRAMATNAGKAAEALSGIATKTNLDALDAKTNKAIDRFKALSVSLQATTGQAKLFQEVARGADASALAPWADAIDKIVAKTKEEAKAQDEVNRALRQRKAAQDALIGQLERRVATIGAQSPLEAIQLDANRLGVGAQAEKLIQQLQSASGSMRDARVNANQLRQAYAQLPAQITDVATSLASGAPAWLVLVQQGGQIKDSFGGVGNAIRALLGLLTPMRVAIGGAVGAVTALAAAYAIGSKEQQEFSKSLILTGNAAGTTAGRMADLARSISSGTQGAAAGVIAQLAASGRVGASQFEAITDAALRMERAGGQALEKTIEQFVALGKDPLSAVKALDAETNFLTGSVYAQIQALVNQGREAEAAALAQQTYADAMKSRAGELETQLGTIEKAWRAVKEGAKSAWDAMLNVGRTDSLSQQVAAIDRTIEAIQSAQYVEGGAGAEAALRDIEVLREKKDALLELVRLEGKGAEAAAQRVEAGRAEKALLDQLNDGRSKARRLEEEIAAAKNRASSAGWSETDPRLLQIIDQLKEKYKETAKAKKSAADEGFELAKSLEAQAGGLSSDFLKKWTDLNAAYAAGKINVERLTAAQAALLKQQPALQAIAEDEKKTREAIAKISEKEKADNEKAVESLQKSIEAQIDRIDKLSMGEEAYDAQRAAQMRAEAQDLEWIAGMKGGNIVLVERARLLRLGADLIGTERGLENAKKAEEASRKAAESALKEWQKVNDQIGQSLTDALMKGGRSVAEYLKGLFRNLVLRPILQPIVAGAAGVIASFSTGGAYAADGSGGQLMSLANSYSALSKAYEYYTGTGTGSLSSQYSAMYGEFARSSVGQYIGLSEGAAVAGNNASAYVAPQMTATGEAVGAIGQYAGYAAIGQMIGRGISGGYSAIGGNSGSSAVNLGTAIGAIWGPIGAAVGGIIGGVVNRAFGRKAPEVTERGIEGSFDASGFSGNAYQDILEKGGWFRSDKNYTVTSAINSDIDKALDEGAAKVRESVTKYTDALGLPAEQMGTVTEKFRIAVTDNEAENTKAVAEALGKYSNALVGAFAVDIEPLRRANETVADAIVRLGANLTGVNDVLTTLGATALQTSLQGADAASKLADVFGGLSGFTSATNAYYQEFFSQAEKSANLTRALGDAFTELGTSVPTTREEFKALVNAQDLMTESGRETFAALMSVSGAFDALQDSADQIAARRAELDIELLRAQGKETEALALERQKELEALRELDPALAQVKEMIYAAVDAAKEAEKWKNVWAGVDSVIGDFLGGEDLARYRAERIQDVLGGAGIDSSVEGIIGATKDDILALWEAVGVDGKQAILDAYGAWKLLQEELAQTEIDKIIDGLGVSADELLDAYREINPEADNLVEAWRKTKSEIEDLQTALDEFTGAAAKSAVDQLRADIAKRDQLRGVIDANNDTALNILAGRGTQEGVDALRRREAELWAEYASTGNPEVAQAITRITLERIKLEGTVAQKSLQAQYDAKYQAELEAYELAKATITLEEAAREAQMDALREQIDAAERLKELAKNAGTFLGGLRAGTLSNLSYTDRLEQQRQLFQTSLVTGEGADQQLTAYLQQAQEMYGGATKTYSDIFTQALADYAAAVGDGAAGADQTIATAEAQLKALEKMAEQAPELEKAVIDTSQAEIDAISALNEVFGKNLDTLSKSIDGQIKVLQEQLEQLKLLKDSQESQITTYGKGVMEIKEKLDELVGPVKRIATTVETEAARA
jgi:phage-related minor tail protein